MENSGRSSSQCRGIHLVSACMRYRFEQQVGTRTSVGEQLLFCCDSMASCREESMLMMLLDLRRCENQIRQRLAVACPLKIGINQRGPICFYFKRIKIYIGNREPRIFARSNLRQNKINLYIVANLRTKVNLATNPQEESQIYDKYS